jgi:outer membrane lipoprotein SlyB
MFMLVRFVRPVLIALGLLAGLAACDQQNAVQPGYVQPVSTGYRGEAGRVMAIHEVQIKGKSGMNDGTLVGGGVGALGGAALGGAVSNSVGGAVVGGLLGAVGGGIAGTAIDQQSGRRGIQVTVQRDDGRQVTIAQPDNGDIQMGDRVLIVYDKRGVASVIRDHNRSHDRS